jgi:hypothetical protein
MWKSIPVGVIRDYRGKPLRTQELDSNIEIVYKDIACPDSTCDFTSTSLKTIQAHIEDHEDEDLESKEFITKPVMTDLNTCHLIFQVLQRLHNIGSKEDPMFRVRRNADSNHARRLWDAAEKALGKDEIRINVKQYTWLHDFLDRTLPKDGGAEALTVASYMFGLNSYSSVLALTAVDERDKESEE